MSGKNDNKFLAAAAKIMMRSLSRALPFLAEGVSK